MWAVEAGDVALPAAVVALVTAALVAVRTGRASRAADASRWPSTPGTILMTSIQVQRTGIVRREVPLVRYTYRVGQEAFQGSRIRAGDERPEHGGAPARQVIDRYPVGANVVVYYDHDRPDPRRARAVSDISVRTAACIVVVGVVRIVVAASSPSRISTAEPAGDRRTALG